MPDITITHEGAQFDVRVPDGWSERRIGAWIKNNKARLSQMASTAKGKSSAPKSAAGKTEASAQAVGEKGSTRPTIGPHVRPYPKGAPPGLSIAQRPAGSFGSLSPKADSEPNIVVKGARAVSDVLSTPAGVVKAAALPVEVAARKKFNINKTKADTKEQERIASLPFGERVRILRSQDWRTLGMTPETQMRQQFLDRSGRNAAEQAFAALGGFGADIATDPLTYAAGGGAAAGRKVAESVARRAGARAGAKAAKVATGVNRAGLGAMGAQQMTEGLPMLMEGYESGNVRSMMQGLLQTLTGGVAGRAATHPISSIPSPARPNAPAADLRAGRNVRGNVAGGLKSAKSSLKKQRKEAARNEVEAVQGASVTTPGAAEVTAPGIRRDDNAVQIGETAQEVPRPLEGRENTGEGSGGVRQVLKGQETAGEGQTKETIWTNEEGEIIPVRVIHADDFWGEAQITLPDGTQRRVPLNQLSEPAAPIDQPLTVTDILNQGEPATPIEGEANAPEPLGEIPASAVPEAQPAATGEPTAALPGQALPEAPTPPTGAVPESQTGVGGTETPPNPVEKMRMEDIEAIGERFNIDLPDRKTFREDKANVYARALREYDDLVQNVLRYDPEKQGTLTNEEMIAGHARARELGRKIDASTPEESVVHVEELTTLAQNLYREKSERGRQLQFLQNVVESATDPASVLMRLEKMTDNRASDAARRSVIDLSNRARETEAAIMSRIAKRAKMAEKGWQQANWGSGNVAVTRADAETARNSLNKILSGAARALPNFTDALQDLTTLARFHYEAGARKFTDWTQAVQEETSNALDPGELERVWAGMRESIRGEKSPSARLAPESFTDRLAQKIGRDKVTSFLDELADEDGTPTLLNKMLAGEAITPAERKEILTAWQKHAPIRKKTTETGAARLLSEIVQEAAKEGRRAAAAKTPKVPGREQALKREIGKLEERIKNKDFSSPAAPRPDTPTEAALRKQLASLREEYRKNFSASPEGQAKETAERAGEAGRRAAGVRARAEAKLSTLGQIRPKRGRPTAEDVYAATYEFAKGARSLDAFAQRMRERYGSNVDAGFLDNLFTEAAQQYSRDNRPLQDIKAEMGKTILQEAERLMPPAKKAALIALRNLDASRAIMTSVDFSGFGRQGGALVGSHPIESRKAFKKMFDAAKTKEGYDAVLHQIAGRKNADNGYYARAGLELTSTEGSSAIFREEDFSAPDLEKIKLIGRPVAASARAYTAVLDVLRADVFDLMAGELDKRTNADGSPILPTDEELQAIGRYINIASGRGQLTPTLAQGAPIAANIFFSPRFLISRFQYLTGVPLWMGQGNVFKKGTTRNIIAKEYARYATTALTIIGLSTQAGAEVELDPRSADFLVMRFPGGTEVDALSGLKQAAVFSARMALGETKNAEGKILDLKAPETPVSPTRWDVGGRFFRSKEAPLLSALHNLTLSPKETEESAMRAKLLPKEVRNLPGQREFTGSDYIGRPTDIPKEAIKLLTPILGMSFYETLTDGGWTAEAASAATRNFLLEAFGATANFRDRDAEAGERLRKKLLRR